MNEEIKLTRDIHNFVRGHLNWEESLRFLDGIIESEEWIQHLEIDMQLHEIACKNMGIEGAPIPRFY